VGDASDPRFASVLAYMEKDMGRYGIPGGAVAIVENGKLAFAAGLGTKQRGTMDPITPSTLFRVASMSKMVLSAAAMKLVEEGGLDVSSPITSYVPLPLESGFDPSSITVSNLLTHTSGIPDIGVASTICPVGPGQSAAWYASHAPQPLWSPPGAVWDYSNQGFSVAGWIIEQASGQSFEDAVGSRVFGPAGMSTATYDTVAATAGDHALGHTASASYQPDAYDCAITRPPAGVIATVLDYAHFAETLLAGGGTMLSPSSVAAMETAHVNTDQLPDALEGYGYGLDVIDGYKGQHVLSHTGEDLGYRSAFVVVPASGFAAIVFYDAEARNALHAAQFALDTFLDLLDVPAPVYTTPSSTWAEYAGQYVDPIVMGPIEVDFDGSSLTWTAPNVGVDHLPLVQSAGDAFTATVNGESGTVTFYPGADGSPQWFVTRGGVGQRQM
jgi:CubicO group peptidase (beta-lactamase class C family)